MCIPVSVAQRGLLKPPLFSLNVPEAFSHPDAAKPGIPRDTLRFAMIPAQEDVEIRLLDGGIVALSNLDRTLEGGRPTLVVRIGTCRESAMFSTVAKTDGETHIASPWVLRLCEDKSSGYDCGSYAER